MVGDINRLFSKIKQSDLPYQVFEDRAAETDRPVSAKAVSTPVAPIDVATIERRMPANEDVASAHAGLFRAYNVEAVLSAEQGRPLADIFRRMARG